MQSKSAQVANIATNQQQGCLLEMNSFSSQWQRQQCEDLQQISKIPDTPLNNLALLDVQKHCGTAKINNKEIKTEQHGPVQSQQLATNQTPMNKNSIQLQPVKTIPLITSDRRAANQSKSNGIKPAALLQCIRNTGSGSVRSRLQQNSATSPKKNPAYAGYQVVQQKASQQPQLSSSNPLNDHIDQHKLSPMRAFVMTERKRNAFQQSKHGFSDYITQVLPEAAHEQTRSSVPLDVLAISTQANTAGRGQHKTMKALLSSGMKTSQAPGTLTSDTVNIPSNIAPIQSKLLQTAKTRHYMRTNQLAANNKVALNSNNAYPQHIMHQRDAVAQIGQGVRTANSSHTVTKKNQTAAPHVSNFMSPFIIDQLQQQPSVIMPQSPKSPTTQTSTKPNSLKRNLTHKLDRLAKVVVQETTKVGPITENSSNPKKNLRKTSQQHVCSEPPPADSQSIDGDITSLEYKDTHSNSNLGIRQQLTTTQLERSTKFDKGIRPLITHASSTENLNGRASSLQVVDVSRVDSNGVVIIRSSNNNSSRQLSVACNRDQKRFKVPQNNVYDDPLHLPKMNSNSSETLSRNKSEDQDRRSTSYKMMDSSKQKPSSHYGQQATSFSRRRMKRQQPRSLVSSKRSLHSNTNVTQIDSIKVKNSVLLPPTDQAMPAVHDLMPKQIGGTKSQLKIIVKKKSSGSLLQKTKNQFIKPGDAPAESRRSTMQPAVRETVTQKTQRVQVKQQVTTPMSVKKLVPGQIDNSSPKKLKMIGGTGRKPEGDLSGSFTSHAAAIVELIKPLNSSIVDTIGFSKKQTTPPMKSYRPIGPQIVSKIHSRPSDNNNNGLITSQESAGSPIRIQKDLINKRSKLASSALRPTFKDGGINSNDVEPSVDMALIKLSQVGRVRQIYTQHSQKSLDTVANAHSSTEKQARQETAADQQLQQQRMSNFCPDEDGYVPSADNLPYNSCKSYVVLENSHASKHAKVLQSKNKNEVREMASLTKMMTAIVTLELASELKMDIKTTYFKVSKKASQTIGTTANMIEGQVLSIWDLLHGLMLPSGNDAAMVLAENFSHRLLRIANRALKDEENDKPIQAPQGNVGPFVKLMNKTTRKVHMRLTNYANSHGLADKSNHSTALEQAQLANYCMRNETFQQIVNTKIFNSVNYVPVARCQKMPHYDFNTWRVYEDSEVPFIHGGVPYNCYYQTWQNSNKLLDVPGFCGVKTGQTTTAGPCLAIYYRSSLTKNKNLITVVLGSKSVEYRWKDTRRLTLWADAVLAEDIANNSRAAAGSSSMSPIKIGRKQPLLQY